jgi:hypothetical protein
VRASLKRLGIGGWDGAINGSYNNQLGRAVLNWYCAVASDEDRKACEDKLKEVGIPNTVLWLANDEELKDKNKHLTARLEQALGGRDHVDYNGCIHIGLPFVRQNTTATIRIEFQDIKFLTREDVVEAMTQAGLTVPDDVNPANINNAEIVYNITDATFKGNDPDLLSNESSQEHSNWCFQITNNGSTIKKPFRNFAEIEHLLYEDDTYYWTQTIYAMTWCQPVWHKTTMFLRNSPRPDNNFNMDADNNQPRQAVESTLPAVPTLFKGKGYNYGPCALFRWTTSGGKSWVRLHPGIDIAGKKGKTPAFALHAGKIISKSRKLIHHGDEMFADYAHMKSTLAVKDKWVKAGTLMGIVGRVGFGNNTGDMPTHVHIHFFVDSRSGGWDNSHKKLLQGENKIKSMDVPYYPEVFTRNENPKYIKYQYGKWIRDPTDLLPGWINGQLGNDGFDKYKLYMPINWPGMYLVPCQGEYTDAVAPDDCKCECKKIVDGKEQAVAKQVKFAGKCWAIKTSLSHTNCSCPGLSKNGPDKCFTEPQQVQYHLWQMGKYKAALDGDLGSGSCEAIDRVRADWESNAVCAVFVQRFNQKTNQLVKNAQAREDRKAKQKKRRAKKITETAYHRRKALVELLRKDEKKQENVNLLLQVLRSESGAHVKRYLAR